MHNITRLARDSRPRERLARYGASTLRDDELWACILGSGIAGRPLHALAPKISQLLAKNECSYAALRQQLGAATAARVMAVQEWAQRHRQPNSLAITSVADVAQRCYELATAKQEWIVVLYCSTRAEVVRQERLALGGLNIAALQPKDIFFPLRWEAVDSIVLCHNHPSGCVEPSPQDIAFTARIEAACSLLGLWLRDHVILAKDQSFSFRSAGFLSQQPQ